MNDEFNYEISWLLEKAARALRQNDRPGLAEKVEEVSRELEGDGSD